jgi:hypothetical protein
MHKSLQLMKNHAVNLSKRIIDELVLPNELKTLKPARSYSEEKYFTRNAEISFTMNQSMN